VAGRAAEDSDLAARRSDVFWNSELLANSSGVQHAIAERLGLDWQEWHWQEWPATLTRSFAASRK